MKSDVFQSDRAGWARRFGPSNGPYWAFVPKPLPPDIEFTDELVSANSAADRALGLLAGVARTLPNPHLLIGSFTRVEAVLSSRIEGTQASFSDLVLFEASPESTPKGNDAREVRNYILALEHGLQQQSVLPLSLRLIRDMHRILMDGVARRDVTPGEFRTTQNWIGPDQCLLTDATFVPPPPSELMDTLSAFERYLHTPSSLPPLVRLALIHYQFEVIHPFVDGNGRLGRLLIPLVLCLDGHLPEPMLYLSAYFERFRTSYYERLLRVSTHGEWEPWVIFFLRAVSHQASDAVERAKMLMDLRDRYRQSLLTARSSVLLFQLVDKLFETPWTTASRASRDLGITFRPAQAHLTRLTESGVLREVTGRKRDRIYLAEEIIRVSQEPLHLKNG